MTIILTAPLGQTLNTTVGFNLANVPVTVGYSDGTPDLVTTTGVLQQLLIDHTTVSADPLTLTFTSTATITQISASNQNLTALSYIDLPALTEVDISRNSISSLDVSSSTLLTRVTAYNTSLTALDFSNNLNMLRINAYDCTSLATANITGCTALERVNLSNTNLSVFDISNRSALTHLDISSASALTLTFDNCLALEHLQANSVTLSDITVDLTTTTSLQYLNLSTTNVTTLDGSGLTSLTEVQVSGSASLNSVNLSGCTALINYAGSSLNSSAPVALNLTGCVALEQINVSLQNISGVLDLSFCPNLSVVRASSTQLTGVLLHATAPITRYEIANTDITSLDLSAFSGLTTFTVNDCTSLTTLNVANTGITALNVSGCSALTTVDIVSVLMGQAAIESTIAQLVVLGQTNGLLDAYDCPGSLAVTTKATLEANGWTVNLENPVSYETELTISAPDATPIMFAVQFATDGSVTVDWGDGGGSTAHNVVANTALILERDKNTATPQTLTINGSPSLEYILGTGLSGLNVTSPTLQKLDVLGCVDLANLTLTTCPALTRIEAERTIIQTLDVGTATALNYINLRESALTLAGANALMSQLVSNGVEDGRLRFDGTPSASSASTTALIAKNWSVVTENRDLVLPVDAEGWTIFTPSSDSRIVYVSSSGDDGTGSVYTRDAAEIGGNVFEPTSILPYATFAAAYAQTRDGYPDFILIKRGDEFTEVLPRMLKHGRSKTEPSVISTYGTVGDSPVFKTGADWGLSIDGELTNFATSGIYFYAHTRNPDSADYVNTDGSEGFKHTTWSGECYGILVEGCTFRFYHGSDMQGMGTALDCEVNFKRTTFLDSYASRTSGHAQGFWAKGAMPVFDECVFDHNGWYSHPSAGAVGPATVYSHNIYMTAMRRTSFIDCMMSNPASMQHKFTADSGTGCSHRIKVINNLTIGGELSLGLGGNYPQYDARFRDFDYQNNVVATIGKFKPTERDLGWAVGFNGCVRADVSGNLILPQTDPTLINVMSFAMGDFSRDVDIHHNIEYDVGVYPKGFHPEDRGEGGNFKRVTFRDNILQHEDHGTDGKDGVIQERFPTEGKISYVDNKYFWRNRTEDQLIRTRREDPLTYSFETMADWRARTGDNSTVEEVVFADTTRSVGSYMGSLGFTATEEEYITRVREMGRFNWNPDLSPKAINPWLREGFFASGNSTIALRRRIMENNNG